MSGVGVGGGGAVATSVALRGGHGLTYRNEWVLKSLSFVAYQCSRFDTRTAYIVTLSP